MYCSDDDIGGGGDSFLFLFFSSFCLIWESQGAPQKSTCI